MKSKTKIDILYLWNTAMYEIRGSLIRFKYPRGTDPRPFIVVIERGEDRIHGFNLNYLTEFKTQRLLMEKNVDVKDKNMPRYNFYKDAYRTYLRADIVQIELIDYNLDTDEL